MEEMKLDPDLLEKAGRQAGDQTLFASRENADILHANRTFVAHLHTAIDHISTHPIDAILCTQWHCGLEVGFCYARLLHEKELLGLHKGGSDAGQSKE